jgi:predicted ATPase/DNA-binding SARP family transcriptional activator
VEGSASVRARASDVGLKTSAMRIGILGQLEVRAADGQLLPVGGARLRSFVIRLAASDGSPVSVDRLAEDLWPREQPADAANAVQALASRLRGTGGRDLIEYGPAGYRVTVGADQVDARAFEQLVAAARSELDTGHSIAAAARFRDALRLWRGPALADVADAPWAAGIIARLTELRLAALEDRIDADLALGRGPELVPEVEALATEHPLRERLRGQLMRSLYAAGRQADALAVFEDTRRVLEASLGIDPSPALAAVHLAILRGELPTGPLPWQAGGDGDDEAAGASDRPARASGAGRGGNVRGGNLPAQLTSFVGRDDELGRVVKLLAESRLITLTGPGGAGKTRLAVESGARLDAPDGVWFVPLAPVRDALDVPQAVLTAIGGHETAWRADAIEAARLAALGPLDRLCELLMARDLVVVLDNCEHVIDAAASLAAQVLASAPDVRILATSREPLGVTGETLAPVPSLQLPAPGADMVELAGNPAIRLFADRAAAVRPGFVVDDENAAAVIAICRALDGIPLAIELAAARVRALTPTQVADRLADRFALLSVASRGTLPRHQTLRAIVDWSWDLLDDAERTILRRLSVFSGGATPESAEQVCLNPGLVSDGAGATTEGRDVVDIIASLLDKSLVAAGGDSHVRYRLLETVRAYAAERLTQAGETDAVAAAHSRYFVELAERAEPQLRSRDQVRWLRLLTAEHENFSAALRYAEQAGDAATLMRLVAALAWYWITHDYDAEAADWALAAARLAPDDVPAELADAHALCQLMSAMAGMRDHDISMERLRETLSSIPELTSDSMHPMLALVAPMLAVFSGDSEAFRAGMEKVTAHPDPWVRAARRLLNGHLAINSGDPQSAGAELAGAYESFQQLGDRFGLMVSLSGLAEVAMANGQPADAVRSLEAAKSFAVEGIAGNWSKTINVALGRARAAAGDVAGGRAEIEVAVRFAERIGELDDAVQGYVNLSELARGEGDLSEARSLLDRAAEIVGSRLRRPDLTFVAASTFSKLGCIAEQEGDLDAAAGYHRQSLDLLRHSPAILSQSNQTLALVVEGIAALTAARDDHRRAAELLGLAHTLQGYRNAASLEVRRVEAATALSKPDFEAAYAAGRRLSQADALALPV